MLITQKIANVLNGVSQRTPSNRPSSQSEAQENMLSHRVYGLRRRPPTTHVAKLGDVIADGTLPVLAQGQLVDFDADLGINSTYPTVVGGRTYTGVNQLENQIPTGSALVSGGEKPGVFSGISHLNGHAMLRAYGSSNNNPMTASMPATGVTEFTMIVVARPGYQVNHASTFLIRDGSNATIAGLGITNGLLHLGGFRTGAPLGETGEVGGISWGGTFVEAAAAWSGQAPSDEYTAADGLGNESLGGSFDVVTLRVVGGMMQFIKNGFMCANQFTIGAGPWGFSSLLVTSSAGGSIDLSGGQQFDWSRILVWPRALTNTEVTQTTRALGAKYGITTA